MRTVSLLVKEPDSLSFSISRSRARPRSEEHTSELQSPYELVCRLLFEKRNKYSYPHFLRTNGIWFERGCDQYLRRDFELEQRRNLQRYRQDSRRKSCRYHCLASRFVVG